MTNRCGSPSIVRISYLRLNFLRVFLLELVTLRRSNLSAIVFSNVISIVKLQYNIYFRF